MRARVKSEPSEPSEPVARAGNVAAELRVCLFSIPDEYASALMDKLARILQEWHLGNTSDGQLTSVVVRVNPDWAHIDDGDRLAEALLNSNGGALALTIPMADGSIGQVERACAS